MKILLATGLYPPEIGGPATYAVMLESELPGRDIEVVTVPFNWVRQYPKIIRHAVYAWKLWRLSKDTDIIYALDPISVGLPASWVARLRRLPFIIRLGGDYAWEQGRIRYGVTSTLDEYVNDTTTAAWQVRMFARLQTFVVRQAICVVVPSKYLKSIVAQWGIDEEKIEVVYSALYPLKVNSDRDTLRAQLNYAYPTIVSSARLVPWKGFEVLIDVVNALKDRYQNISLVIIGDGEEKNKLEKQVLKFGLEQHVSFAGRIAKDALGASLKAADVFVLNTAYEGLSHQLIEVMDLGVPVVTTSSGGNPELVTDGVNGYLVDFNDVNQLKEAIIKVLDNPEPRERMIQSARLRAKDFQKNVVVEGIVKILKNVYVEK